jgi:hypothetical protein
MQVKVFHAKTNFFRTSVVYNSDLAARKYIAEQFKTRYEEVAEVDVDVPGGRTTTGILDEAFGRTQNIDHPWVMNEGVSSSATHKRSSSVGDVFLFDNRYYIVAQFGFDDVTDLFKEYGHA